MGAGKIRFEHLRQTKDLAATSRENQDGNIPFLNPYHNQGPRLGTPEGRINRSFSSHKTTGPHPVTSSSKLYPLAGRPTLKPRIHLRKANNLTSRSFLAYRSIFFPNESAGRGAYLSFLSQSAFFFRPRSLQLTKSKRAGDDRQPFSSPSRFTARRLFPVCRRPSCSDDQPTISPASRVLR
jgi:hypothetical protein